MKLRNIDALHVLAVAPSIHHGAAKNTYDLQMLTVATNQLDALQIAGVGVRVRIREGVTKHWMLYHCSLYQQKA
jgi:hypothetical protein